MNIFIDIETVRQYNTLKEAPDQFRLAWTSFSMKNWPEENSHKTFEDNGGIYPEFGKIICISVKRDEGDVVSFYGDDENDLLKRFSNAILKMELNAKFKYVGHRIKTFDIPWINTRMIAFRLPVLNSMRTYGVKPWELSHIVDTWEIWKGGIYNSVQAASLETICMTLGIPSPKEDISGADVGRVYWEEKDIERIVTYCEKDVDRTASAFNVMQTLIL